MVRHANYIFDHVLIIGKRSNESISIKGFEFLLCKSNCTWLRQFFACIGLFQEGLISREWVKFDGDMKK